MNVIIRILLTLKVDLVFLKIQRFLFLLKLMRYEKLSGQKINFVPQGPYSLNLLGDLKKFKIHPTSHLKSDTTIECSGGVEIGKYFHTGKGLTIFSANHNWKGSTKIPYDEQVILKKVIIKDFVWIGANVTILPGVTINEGAIVSGGAVVAKDVLQGQIVGGNPAKELGKRDMNRFNKLKNKKLFY